MAVSDVSGKAIANLATEELSHPNPVFHGDTLFCETEVLEVKPSKSKPDRGIVKVHTRVLNQDGVLVAEFKRLVLVPAQDARRRRRRLRATSSRAAVPRSRARRTVANRRDAEGSAARPSRSPTGSFPDCAPVGPQRPVRPVSPEARLDGSDASITVPHQERQAPAWVEEVAALTQPDAIHWCDGSAEEYDRLCQELVDAGTFERSRDAKRPNSYLALVGPGRRRARRGPHVHLLRARGGRRPDQQLARPGRDARRR